MAGLNARRAEVRGFLQGKPWTSGIAREGRADGDFLLQIASAAAWAAAALLLLASAHLQYPFQSDDYRYDPLEAAFYLALHRPAWALGVASVVYACERGHGGIVNALLSSAFFRPAARLSYGIYLTHMSVIHLMGGSARTPIYLSDLTMVNAFVGVLVMSIAWTLPLALLFEAPFVALEEVIFEKEDEDSPGDLPPSLETPMPFKMPSQLKRLPEMTQINDDAETPQDDEVLDERL
ncbi:hypothetical protein R5R35_003693 [Gryllus longicercus]|uniref:Acyltransferase 3 domain-containing protein n=1 Tax=Gryllus longicercus TaxID=2509291 RepID=A0AAN9V6V7_9ORTH